MYSLILGIICAKNAGMRLKATTQLFIKRFIDVFLSGIGLLILSPAMLVIMLLIKMDSRGPVLFKQKRVGLGKREFVLYNFRTMKRDAPGISAKIAEVDGIEIDGFDQKALITRIGRFLRKFSLEELPQLLNVFKGDMSLIGPRPTLAYEAGYKDERISHVLPGITCLWQVSGGYNLSFQDWVKLDLDYVLGWSLFLDIKIAIKTIPVVLFGIGAY